MKITIKRSNGFAGIEMPPKILITDDPAIMEEARYVACENYTTPNAYPDRMQYEITVEENRETKKIIIEDNDNEVFQSLLRRVL